MQEEDSSSSSEQLWDKFHCQTGNFLQFLQYVTIGLIKVNVRNTIEHYFEYMGFFFATQPSYLSDSAVETSF